MKAESIVNLTGFKKALNKVKRSVASARKNAGSQGFAFDLKNIARDKKARNEDHDIYYFDAVDKGRKKIVALQNRTNAYPELHFKVGSGDGDWEVRKSVKASRPARIRQKAKQALRASLARRVVEAFPTDNTLPDGTHFLKAFALMKEEVIEQYRQATLKSTKEHNTKLRFYGVAASPLSESFVAESK